MSKWLLTSTFSKLFRSIRKRGFLNTLDISFKFATKDVMMSSLRQIYYFLKYKRSYPKPYETIHVDARDIEFKIVPQFSKEYSQYGHHVIGGDWDIREYDPEGTRGILHYDDWPFYKSFEEHFTQEIPWEETEFYREMIENPPEGRTRYGSKKKAEKRFKDLDRLYNNMKNHGYKSQNELISDTGSVLSQTPIIPEHNEIKVAIGRDGDIFLEDGRHRAAMASILDIKNIPVRIMVRHKEWQERRRRIANSSIKPGDIEIDPSHPDLQDVLQK